MWQILLIALLLTSCNQNVDFPQVPREVRKEAQQQLTKGYNQLGWKLLSALREDHAEENIFISPMSIAFALAMTYNGAAAETKTAMSETLGITGLSLEEVNKTNYNLRVLLHSSDPKVQIHMANSLWAKAGIAFKKDFLERNREYFGARIATLDFAAKSAPNTINTWVRRHTKGKIDSIVDSIDREMVLFLINALYFKGEWKEQFDAEKTRDNEFTLLSGDKKQVPTMFQTESFPYLEEEKFQALALPYGNGRVKMYVFLPAPDSSVAEFVETLDQEHWDRWLGKFHEREGKVGLPRFRTEYEKSVKEVLSAMGMDIAFDPQQADFSGMRSDSADLYIDDVKHKTFVEVNEEGTEAAAVTSVEMKATSYTPPFSFIVDRPFFFAIRDDISQTILFLGTIVNPQ